jgi:hypothetical protein
MFLHWVITSTALSSHGKLNVFTGCHDTSTAISSHGQLNVFTGGHHIITGMSSKVIIIFLQVVMSLVLQ